MNPSTRCDKRATAPPIVRVTNATENAVERLTRAGAAESSVMGRAMAAYWNP